MFMRENQRFHGLFIAVLTGVAAAARYDFISVVEVSLHGVPSLITCGQSILGGSGLIANGTKGGMAEWFKAHAWKACWG